VLTRHLTSCCVGIYTRNLDLYAFVKLPCCGRPPSRSQRNFPRSRRGGTDLANPPDYTGPFLSDQGSTMAAKSKGRTLQRACVYCASCKVRFPHENNQSRFERVGGVLHIPMCAYPGRPPLKKTVDYKYANPLFRYPYNVAEIHFVPLSR